MDGMQIVLLVPMIIFLTIVAPIWIFMHYRGNQRSQTALSDEERLELETLAAHADRMLERIDTLEAILDSETPGWRKRLHAE